MKRLGSRLFDDGEVAVAVYAGEFLYDLYSQTSLFIALSGMVPSDPDRERIKKICRSTLIAVDFSYGVGCPVSYGLCTKSFLYKNFLNGEAVWGDGWSYRLNSFDANKMIDYMLNRSIVCDEKALLAIVKVFVHVAPRFFGEHVSPFSVPYAIMRGVASVIPSIVFVSPATQREVEAMLSQP